MVGNPDHGGAGSGEAVFLCIASARRELPHLPQIGHVFLVSTMRARGLSWHGGWIGPESWRAQPAGRRSS